MDIYSRALKSKRRRANVRRTQEATEPALDAAVNGHAMGTIGAGGMSEKVEQRAF